MSSHSNNTIAIYSARYREQMKVHEHSTSERMPRRSSVLNLKIIQAIGAAQ